MRREQGDDVTKKAERRIKGINAGGKVVSAVS